MRYVVKGSFHSSCPPRKSRGEIILQIRYDESCRARGLMMNFLKTTYEEIEDRRLYGTGSSYADKRYRISVPVLVPGPIGHLGLAGKKPGRTENIINEIVYWIWYRLNGENDPSKSERTE